MCPHKCSHQIVHILHNYIEFNVIMCCTKGIMLCALHIAQYALCIVQYALSIAECALCACIAHCAICAMHCIVCMLTRSITGMTALCGLTRVTRLVHYTRIWATLYVRLALYRWEGGGPQGEGRQYASAWLQTSNRVFNPRTCDAVLPSQSSEALRSVDWTDVKQGLERE